MSSDDVGVQSRLRHILDHAEFLRTSLHGLTVDRFIEDRTLVLASLYSLLIVGEASIAIPQAVKELRPDLPWQGMRGMRNVIAHRYYKVDLGIVWNAIQNVFLPLEEEFRTLLDSLPGDD